MKAIVNKYAEITPTFFGLVEFEKHKEETFGSCVLIEDGILYTKKNNEWVAKHNIHVSKNRTIYFETKNRDLLIGKMYPEGFRVLKIKNHFEENEKRPAQLVLEVFDEILQEMEDTESLNKLLNNLNINLNT